MMYGVGRYVVVGFDRDGGLGVYLGGFKGVGVLALGVYSTIVVRVRDLILVHSTCRSEESVKI
jgi:hypothetical protein